MSTHATHARTQTHSSKPNTAVSTVFVDPLTGLFHATDDVAGEYATEYTRPQAELLGHSACRDCFGGGAR